MPAKILDYEEVTSLDFSLAEESKARIKYNDLIKKYNDIIKGYDDIIKSIRSGKYGLH